MDAPPETTQTDVHQRTGAAEPAAAVTTAVTTTITTITTAATTAAITTARRRRRLWDLPAEAHALLLAMSFAPDALRRETARVLGRMHRGVWRVDGSDAEVLHCLLPDLARRNPLSEALQQRLDERHAGALRRCVSLRDEAALASVWTQVCADRDPDLDQAAGVAPAMPALPGLLWAVLSHRHGPALQPVVLRDAQAWVHAQARRGIGRQQAARQDRDAVRQARAQRDALGLRLMAQQQHAAAALAQAKAEIARLRGELARRVTTEVSAPAHRAEPDPVRPAATPAAAMAPARAPVMAQARPAVSAAVSAAESAAESAAVVVGPSVQSGAAFAQPITVHGRRVLCVGGMQHAVARYRSRVERLGGLFDHHDGGLEDSVQALDGRLRRAELVICQAACINHEAYHRIKRHCERTGTPCIYLERPSLSRFDRALQGMAAAEPGAGPGVQTGVQTGVQPVQPVPPVPLSAVHQRGH